MTRTKSPKYPNYPLSTAIENARKIYNADRTAPLPREVIARHLGYSGLSGASDSAIATLGQYGLLQRIGKGQVKVSQLAVDILVPENEAQKQAAINRAALSPPLFAEIWNHFEQRLPSEQALRTYLLRREFHNRAIEPVLRSLEPTVAMMKQPNEMGSGGTRPTEGGESTSPEDDAVSSEVSAAVGDYIQWENQGVLQFKEPRRVRWVSSDGDYLAVDGSDTGIPMSEVTIEDPPIRQRHVAPPPEPREEPTEPASPGFTEWFRAKVGADKLITVNFKGEGEIGPREIEKMIKILEAQKLALED